MNKKQILLVISLFSINIFASNEQNIKQNSDNSASSITIGTDIAITIMDYLTHQESRKLAATSKLMLNAFYKSRHKYHPATISPRCSADYPWPGSLHNSTLSFSPCERFASIHYGASNRVDVHETTSGRRIYTAPNIKYPNMQLFPDGSLMTLEKNYPSSPILKRWNRSGELMSKEDIDMAIQGKMTYLRRNTKSGVAISSSDKTIQFFSNETSQRSSILKHTAAILALKATSSSNLLFVDEHGVVTLCNGTTGEQISSLQSTVKKPNKIIFKSNFVDITETEEECIFGDFGPQSDHYRDVVVAQCFILNENRALTLSQRPSHQRLLSNGDEIKMIETSLQIIDRETGEIKRSHSIESGSEVKALNDDRVMVRSKKKGKILILPTESYFQRKAVEEAAARQSKKIEEAEGGSK